MMPWRYGLGGFGGFGGFGMLFGGLMMLLFWVGLIVLGYFLVRALIRAGRAGSVDSHAQPAGNRAQEIVKERYARGEITKEQFDQMRQALNE